MRLESSWRVVQGNLVLTMTATVENQVFQQSLTLAGRMGFEPMDYKYAEVRLRRGIMSSIEEALFKDRPLP